MRRFFSKYKLTIALLVFALIGFLFLIAAVYFNAIVNQNQDTIIRAIANQARAESGVQLDIDNLYAEFPFSISIHNLVMSDPDGQKLLSIDKTLIRADWLNMILNPDQFFESLRYIEIQNPIVVAYTSDGTFNWMKLFKDKPDEPALINWDKINLKLVIRGCRIQTNIISDSNTDIQPNTLWTIPVSINADFLLADGELVLYPRLRTFWTENNLFQNNINDGFHDPLISIRGAGSVSGDIILNGKIDIHNFDKLFNSSKLFINELSDWDIQMARLSGKFDIRLANVAGGNPDFSFDLEIAANDFILNTPIQKIDQLNFSQMTFLYSQPENIAQINFDTHNDYFSSQGFVQIFDMVNNQINGEIQINNISSNFIIDNQFNDGPVLDGIFNIDLFLSGNLTAPVVNGVIHDTQIIIARQNFTLTESMFLFKGNTFSLPGLKLICPSDGSISINGFGNPFENKYTFVVNGTDISSHVFNQISNLNGDISNIGNSNFTASVEIDKDTYQAHVNGNLSSGEIMGIRYQNINGIVDINHERISIKEIMVRPVNGGIIQAKGNVYYPDTLDLHFDLAELKLGDYSNSNNLSNGENFTGTLFGSAIINGSLKNPLLSFALRAYNGNIAAYAFDKLEFNAELSDQGLAPVNIKILATGSELEFNAEYLYASSQPLTVWGVWKNIPISASLEQPSSQSMMISGSGSFTGDFDDLNGVLKVAFDGYDGLGNKIHTTYNDQTMDLYDPFDYGGSDDPENNVFFGWFLDIDFAGLTRFHSIEDLFNQVNSNLDTIIQSGFISQGELDLSGGVRLESLATESDSFRLLSTLSRYIIPLIPGVEMDLPERKMPSEVELPLDGLLSIDINILREKDNWNLYGKAQGIDFTINTEKISMLSAEIDTITDDKFQIALDFSQGEGQLSVIGQIDLHTLVGASPLDLDIVIDSYPVKSLVNLSGYKPEEEMFEGLLDGSGKLTGNITNPKLEEINLSILSARLFGIPLENSFVKFSLSGSRIEIDRFQLSDGEDFLAVAVGVLELDPTNISGNRLNFFVDSLLLENLSVPGILPDGLSGELSLVTLLEYNPNTLEPQIIIDLAVDKPKFNNIGIDRIKGEGIIDAKTGIMHLGDFSGQSGEALIKMDGTVQPRLSHGDILLNLNVSTQDFDISPLVEQLGIPLKSDISSFSMNLEINGTTSNPLLNGDLDAKITSPLYDHISIADNISVHAIIKDNILNLDGRLIRDDSSLAAKGEFDIFNLKKSVTNGNGFGASSPALTITNIDNKPFPFKNFGLDVDVIMAGKSPNPHMTLTIGDGTSRLSGIIKVVSGSYKLAPIQVASGASGSSPVELDLTVEIYDGFPVSSGNVIDISLEKSSLIISGTPSFPTADGELVVKEGHLRLLDRTFLINRAQLQFKEFLSIDNPYLKGDATTTIISGSIRNLRGTENLVVTARIDARLRQLSSGIQFTSDRGTFTEEELMGIILRQDLFEGFQDEGILETLAAQALTIPGAYLSRYFESRGGFRVFQIGVNSQGDVFVYLQYETFDDLFLDHYQVFGSGLPEFKSFVKYQVRPDSFIGLGTDQKGSIIFKVEYIFSIR